jgi:WD40 repeat protein
VKLWNFQEITNELVYLCTLYGIYIYLIKGHQKWVWDAAFSVDSDYLITGSSDCIAKIWDIKEAKDIRNLRSHKKGIRCDLIQIKY